MHLATVLSFLFAVAVSARGNLGYALGARNRDGTCKTTNDYELDFDTLRTKGGSTMIRTYAVTDLSLPSQTCNVASEILPAAKAKGFQVILGLSADTQEAYEAEKAALSSVLTSEYASNVYALTIGSESLYRGITACDLLPRIVDARNTFGKLVKRVGTVDSWNKFQDGTADPIVSGKKIEDATYTYLDDLQQAIGHIQNLAGLNTVEIMNGETGWPGDGGSKYGAAEPSNKNEETFFKTGVCAALAWGIDVFYFEAFDESWKPKSTGDTGVEGDETHWGAFYDNRTPKFSLTC
ncbi:MAG: hypothetical protein Q9166_004459 [cf. Caloplaca sp. 2 TL-2023]